MSIGSGETPKVPVEIKASLEGDLAKLLLIFSVDSGRSWYEVPMKASGADYSVTIPNVEKGVNILYCFKAIGPGGEEFLENNGGNFFIQIAGAELDEMTENVDAASGAAPTSETYYSEAPPTVPQTDAPADVVPEFVPESTPETNTGSSDIPDFPAEVEADGDGATKFVSQPNDQTAFISQPGAFESPSPAEYVSPKPEATSPAAESPGTRPPHQKKDISRPIIAINPFSLEYGELGQKMQAIQSFSQIIGARLTDEPSKKKSFVTKPKLINENQCDSCKAIVKNKAWKICPICGSKI